MIPSHDTPNVFNIIFPQATQTLSEIKSTNKRFAYYTSAETAAKIIRNKEVWLRNATVMNDFSEIRYGLSRVWEGLAGSAGTIFYAAVESLFSGLRTEIETRLRQSESYWKYETYLTCLSLHNPSEDQTGRLSMWRAYGDVALIMNHTPFTAETDRLDAFSTPVHYLDQKGFDDLLLSVTREISANVNDLRQLGREALASAILELIFLAAIGIKHPGFSEEREWRIFFHPTDDEHPVLTKRVENVRGIPQSIWAIPLRHDPDNGLVGANIPNLLDRIIIGPTAYPYVSARAFIQLLSEAGVEEAASKVVVSDIPLRKLG